MGARYEQGRPDKKSAAGLKILRSGAQPGVNGNVNRQGCFCTPAALSDRFMVSLPGLLTIKNPFAFMATNYVTPPLEGVKCWQSDY
jgi:hypothetical protein